MERTTRLIVVIGAVALLAGNLALGRAWVGMPATAAAALLAGAGLALYDRRAVALVLASSCLFPPLIWLTLDTFGVHFWILWIAALLGVLLPRLLTTPWQLPPVWRAPLVLTALVVVVAAPLIVAREVDFNPALLGDMPFAVLSGLPRYSAEWVLLVAVTTLTGILWFDWLAGVPDIDVDRTILQPLVLSIGVSSLVAVYQMFADVTLLNPTVYGAMGRASGTLFDGNVAGLAAAVGIGLVFAIADGETRRPTWLALVPLFGLAVWASGSRTASGAAIVVLLTSAVVWWRRTPAVSVRLTRGMAAAVATALVAVTLAVLTARGATTIGPLQRFARMLPGANGRTAGGAVVELWNRNGYGAAATYLIERYPLVGIGLGTFHQFGPPMTPIGALPPDNAQNWLRHQVVELGVLGSLGWVLFATSFAGFVVRGRRIGEPRRLAHLRGVLVAFAIVSLFGMPTQEVVPLVLFWTAAGGLARQRAQAEVNRGLARSTLVAVALVTLAFAGVTWQLANSRLRVPVRARQLGWPYSYGFYWPEPDGAGGTVRWMARRATELVDVQGRYLRIAVRAPLPNVERDPVRIAIWSEGRLVLDTLARSGDAVHATVRVPVGLRQLLVDLRVSRTVRPRDADPAADDRELGALVSWTFTSAP